MRYLIIIFTFLLFTSCEVNSPKTTVITILADRTDTLIPQPSVQDIKPLLSLKKHPNEGVVITLQNIGNVDYSKSYKLELESSSILDNTLQRSVHIKRFYNALDSLVIRENTKKYNFQSSSILSPLIMQLQELSSRSYSEKTVFLYSDLLEFSDLYDGYKNQAELLTSPKKVAEELKRKLDIPRLDNTRLYIMYYPNTNMDNRLFHAMINVYREVFKTSGLQIEIGREEHLKL